MRKILTRFASSRLNCFEPRFECRKNFFLNDCKVHGREFKIHSIARFQWPRFFYSSIGLRFDLANFIAHFDSCNDIAFTHLVIYVFYPCLENLRIPIFASYRLHRWFIEQVVLWQRRKLVERIIWHIFSPCTCDSWHQNKIEASVALALAIARCQPAGELRHVFEHQGDGSPQLQSRQVLKILGIILALTLLRSLESSVSVW
mmetsp:Transcript_60024/g.115769  ORF Transcript_60024/g.115769 Transcript_60024/m.115769 type:complete len:202 (+) Transcript_60024:167-772(+)